MPRTKMTRHQLKEQDEITTSLQTFTELVVARRKQLTAAGIVLAVLVVAIFGWRFYSSRRDAAAQAQLSQAITIFNDTLNIKSDKERYDRTIAEAQKTRDQYGSSSAGMIALYYIALSQEGLGDKDKAIQNLQEVAQRGGDAIKPVAQFALASIYAKHGENDKAIDGYKQLYDGGAYSRPAVAYELARTYEAANQPDQAKEYYQKIVSEFPDSAFRQNADDALKRLGVAAPPATPQKPS